MDGYLIDRAAVEATADALRTGGAALEGTTDPPPEPEAGECTAGIAAVLALLTDSMASVVEGLDVVAAAAIGNLTDYEDAERSSIEAFDSLAEGD